MLLGFALYKYFPFGGLQRDFLRIALECQRRGHAIRVYVLSWQGPVPEGFEVVTVPVRAWTSHRRYQRFSAWLAAELRQHSVDRLVGFNKMPGLDVYYAADPCFEHRARTLRGPWYRWLGRYRHFAGYERAVFAPEQATRILMISALQQPLFQQYYGTPAGRFYPLPPGIDPGRRAPANAAGIRARFRQAFGLDEQALLVLQIGSGFRTKGLDRSLRALAALPPSLKGRARLVAIGQDDPAPFVALARRLGVSDRVQILKGRDDIPEFLLGADLLIHPAYSENTGTVLLEALVAGLPVLVTDVCGYAHYIAGSGGGEVLASPFDQARLNQALASLLASPARRAACARQGLAHAATADLYALPRRAADIILGEVT